MSKEQQVRLQNVLTDSGLGNVVAELTPDASTREFYRIESGDTTLIGCVYAAGDTEGPRQLIDVTNLFVRAGLPVARVIRDFAESGIVILEDLGEEILREYLLRSTPEDRDDLINAAIDLIPRIQSATELAITSGSVAGKLRFDREKLLWELNFFKEHYFTSLRGQPIDASEDSAIEEEFNELSVWLEDRASVLCHRDFHAANLMVRSDGSLAIIDHQDARIGSPAYDLVSLLLDRITEPPSDSWLDEKITYFLVGRSALGLAALDKSDFRIEFDHQTVQRCLKAVGTFSYQSAFRGKHHFEAYIQPMFCVVLRSIDRLGKYPTLRKILTAELR
ncbi:MAG: phosphotransferase [Acidobacteria bacterium]|nr:phosphotransferase [Acidobacteriota bacterium]